MQATQEKNEVADEVLDRAEINGDKVIVKYSKTEATLAEYRQKYDNVVFPVSTTQGDKEARAARMDLVSLRTGLEATRKTFKSPALAYGKLIDSEAARITTEIEALEKPIDQQIKVEEKRKADIKAEKDRIEAERVAALQSRLDAIRACATKAQCISAERIATGIEKVESIDVANGWEEFTESAVAAKVQTLATMRELLEQAQAREAEAARVELQRLENERIAAEQAAEAKRLQAIADEQAAQQKAAADALAAQQKAAADKLAAEQAELQRQREEFAEQQRAAAAEKQRLADEAAEAERLRVEASKPVIIAPELSLLTGDLLDDMRSDPGVVPVTQTEIDDAIAFIGSVLDDGAVKMGHEINEMMAVIKSEPTLKLGTIQERLGLPITAAKLEELGFAPVIKGASKMYHDESFPAMCDAVSMAAQKAKAEYLEAL